MVVLEIAMRVVGWLAGVSAALVFAGCAPAALRPPDVTSAVDRYLALPRDIETIVREPTDEAARRAAVRQLLADTLSDPLLARLTRWFDAVELNGEAVPDVLESIRPVGPRQPLRIAEVTRGRARAQTDITVVETYGLGYNLTDVKDLFQQYPIANIQLDDLSRLVAASNDPDAITFEVSSSRRLMFSLQEVDDEWRVADVTDTITTATLRLIPIGAREAGR